MRTARYGAPACSMGLVCSEWQFAWNPPTRSCQYCHSILTVLLILDPVSVLIATKLSVDKFPYSLKQIKKWKSSDPVSLLFFDTHLLTHTHTHTHTHVWHTTMHMAHMQPTHAHAGMAHTHTPTHMHTHLSKHTPTPPPPSTCTHLSSMHIHTTHTHTPYTYACRHMLAHAHHPLLTHALAHLLCCCRVTQNTCVPHSLSG